MANMNRTKAVSYTHLQKYQEIGAVCPKGALLVGPPGTGKKPVSYTHLISAIKIPEQSYYAQYKAGGEVRCETMSNVIVKENETLDSALRRFKRNCAKAGIQQEIRKREHYDCLLYTSRCV